MARGANKGSLLLASAVAGMIAFAGAPSSVSAECCFTAGWAASVKKMPKRPSSSW